VSSAELQSNFFRLCGWESCCLRGIPGGKNVVQFKLQHGNYEQAASQAGCDSVAMYLKTTFAGEVE